MNYQIPKAEIELAVRAGFLTRSIWEQEFASGLKTSWRYERWRKLIERGFFKPHPSPYATSVIVPNAEHPKVKEMVGDFVAHPPSVAVLAHDEKVLRTYLNLKKDRSLAFAKFEAELKKEDLRNKRIFDPTDATKFPDLLIGFHGPNAGQRIALEFELSRKEPKRYRQMMISYVCHRDISAIIFVTDLDVIKNGIRAAIRETYFPEWDKPVGFASLGEVMDNPMTAKITLAEGQTNLQTMQIGKKAA
jgi:hypothetical protein